MLAVLAVLDLAVDRQVLVNQGKRRRLSEGMLSELVVLDHIEVREVGLGRVGLVVVLAGLGRLELGYW